MLLDAPDARYLLARFYLSVSRLHGTVLQADDKEFVLLQGMWHILVKEAGNEQVIARVIDWLTARS